MVGFPPPLPLPAGGSVFQVLNTGRNPAGLPLPKLSYSRVAWEGVPDPELMP